MAVAITQQNPLPADTGAILTIGFVSGNDRVDVVMPVGCFDPVDPNVGLAQLVTGIQTTLFPAILDVISADSEIIFAQAEAMVIGSMVPNREDFLGGTFPGTRDTDVMPSDVGALTAFYGDPATPGPAGGILVGKTNWPGIAEDDVTSGRIEDALYTNLITLGTLLGNGFGDAAMAPRTWYRVAGAERTSGSVLVNVVNMTVRRYTATQRRRILPH